MADAIRVMTWAGGWGDALRSAVSDTFSRASGIPIEHHTHVGLALPAALEQALCEGRPPPFDVVWSNSGPALRMARAGRTTPLDGLCHLDGLHPRAVPEGCGPHASGAWPLVYVYVVFYVLVYRKALYPGGAPRSWDVLRDPRHRGRVALYPGGNGLYPIAQHMGGGRIADIPDDMEPCWRYVRTLRDQVGQLDYSIGMGSHLRAEKLDLCFRALTNALAFQAEGLDVDFAAPDEGISDTLDCLWIPAGLDPARVDGARRFIEHAISPAVQTDWCARLGALPVSREAEVPRLVREHPGLPDEIGAVDRLLHLPEWLKADHQAEWEARFARELLPPGALA